MSATPRRDPKSGTWWFVVELPPGGDGRRHQAKRRGFATKAAAQAALDDLRVGVRRGGYVAPVHQTFGEFLLDDWLPAIRATVEPSTHASYARYIRLHVVPRIGGIGLQRLDAGVLNKLYSDLLSRNVSRPLPRNGLTRSSAVRWATSTKPATSSKDSPNSSTPSTTTRHKTTRCARWHQAPGRQGLQATTRLGAGIGRGVRQPLTSRSGEVQRVVVLEMFQVTGVRR